MSCEFNLKSNEEINVYNYLKANKAKSVALFAQNKNTYTYFIGKLRFYGIKVDTPLVENIEERIHIKQNWWCHLMPRRMLSVIVCSCMDLCPILCIACLETVFVLSHLHICTFFLNGC